MRTIYTPLTHLTMYFGHLGIPLANASYDGTVITVEYASEATPEQIAQGDAILADWDYRFYQARPAWDILSEITPLSNSKKDAILADLYGTTTRFMPGTPKVLEEWTDNTPAQFVLHGTSATMGAADKRNWRTYGIALYCQDYPYYLVNPPFDPSLNISGIEPAS